MLKVNSEAILHTYRALVDAREAGHAQIEAAARTFAVNRGYDEEKTAAFVDYVSNVEGDGLSDEERATLSILGKFVENVTDEAMATEAANGEAVD